MCCLLLILGVGGDGHTHHWPYCYPMRLSSHQSFRLTSGQQTEWTDLTRLRRHVVLSLVMLLCWIPFGFLVGWIASMIGPMADKLAPVAMIVFISVSFGYNFSSWWNLVFWRCPACNKSFFGTSLRYCSPFGNTCRNCSESRPSI